jgi:transposase
MPRPYSSDLRGRVLAAWDGGERPSAVAERFCVARATVYLWLRQRRDEGRTEAKRLGGGPKPTIRDEAEAALVRLVEDRRDRTLAEYPDGLAAAPGGVRVHPWTVGRALRRLGRTRKKEDPACRRAGRGGRRGGAAGLVAVGGA